MQIKTDLNSKLVIGICFVILSCTQVQNEDQPVPILAAGTSKLTGEISNFHRENDEILPTLTLIVPNPVTATHGNFVSKLNPDGTFGFEVPIECDTTLCILMSDLFERSIYVSLSAGSETKLKINNSETGNINVTVSNKDKLTSDDMIHLLDVMTKMITHVSPERIPRYNMLIEDFIPFEFKSLERKLSIANNDSILSDVAKQIISNEFKLTYLKIRLLDYKDVMKGDFMRYNDPKDWDKFNPIEPDKSYYALLKYFDLNDPQYLYNPTYPDVLQNLLSNKTLNIPEIGDTPIENWLKEVKSKMTDLIGTDTGLFYDLLAANAYSRQFNSKTKPLSDKQKKNIQGYFKNEAIPKILLRKNEEIVKIDEEVQRTITNINTTPDVPLKALMNTIMSKYKGKAVLVDLWATWCIPCMEAMEANKKVKNELRDRNIVFVYITDVSSPKEIWQEKIKLIGGDHYYLTNDQFHYLMDGFEVTGVPTYLFYDAQGIMKSKITGYPGAEKMQKTLESLLL